MTAADPTGKRWPVPGGLDIDLAVEAGNWPDEAVLDALVSRAVGAAFANADLSLTPQAELSILFTDDAAIRILNRQWRQKDSATNVLSFPGSDPEGEIYGPILGDIAFAYETIVREADEFGIEFANHLTHLTVHGLLHLFDYDHQDEDEAEQMETLERTILAALGIDDPYAGRPLVADHD